MSGLWLAVRLLATAVLVLGAVLAVVLVVWGVRRIWRDRSDAWTIRRPPPVPTSS